jgi:ABC-2 type transport system permease protein
VRNFVSDWFYLSARCTKQIWRPLLALIPSLFIPIFFFFVNANSLGAIAKSPGFPNVSYRDFIAPVAMFTAVFFSAGNAGIEMVQDISNGYFKKLMIMPINRLAILLGRLTEVAIQAVMQGLIVLVLLLAVGVNFRTGFFGIISIFVILILFAMAWSCVSMIAALRTQNARLVQSMFVIVFPFLYITTSQAPKSRLSPTFRVLSSYNPVTYVIEGVRALVISGWSDPAIPEAFATVVVLFLILVVFTLASFQKAMK